VVAWQCYSRHVQVHSRLRLSATSFFLKMWIDENRFFLQRCCVFILFISVQRKAV